MAAAGCCRPPTPSLTRLPRVGSTATWVAGGHRPTAATPRGKKWRQLDNAPAPSQQTLHMRTARVMSCTSVVSSTRSTASSWSAHLKDTIRRLSAFVNNIARMFLNRFQKHRLLCLEYTNVRPMLTTTFC